MKTVQRGDGRDRRGRAVKCRFAGPGPNAIVVVAMIGFLATVAVAQSRTPFRAKDPGPRPNPASVIPKAVDGLNGNEAALFNESLLRVSELEGSCDTCPQQPPNVKPIDPDPSNPLSPTSLVNSAGMSPVFNADQCFICHSQPTIGGSTPAHSPAELIAHRLGGTNTVPSFEEPDGPFREVRFKYHPDGTRDGGVHSLFTLQGRSDTPGCTLQQPDFDKAERERNIAFRIPLQLFGLGLIESIQDSAILANMNANREAKRALGIERPSEPRPEQRHHQPLRMEGSERLHHHLRRRRRTTWRWASATTSSRWVEARTPPAMWSTSRSISPAVRTRYTTIR